MSLVTGGAVVSGERRVDEETRRRRLRLQVRTVIHELIDLGFTPEQLRGKSLPELDILRAHAIEWLMAAPASDRASS